MQMELKIAEIAKEYKQNRDAFMRVRPKTKKKVRAFERWLCENHLNKDDIVECERCFFDFCDYCKEITLFNCSLFNLAWSFELSCRCERARIDEQNKMRDRIRRAKRFTKEVENEKVQRLF